jgi:hypothetical protein
MTRLTVSALCLMTVCLWATPAGAQEEDGASDPPAHISLVEGVATLERDGRSDTDLMSMPLLAGDRLRTQGGRVEVLFADGSALHLDANTMLDFQSDEVVRLLQGRVRLSVAGRSRDLSYRIDAPSAWVQISTPGEYRISVVRSDEVELAVLRGSAELVNEQGRSYISAGERTFARAGTAPSAAYVFNSAAWDDFDRWSESRRDRRLGVSAQYLPDDVRRYAPAFEAHGNWRYEQVHGYVWYPRVQVGWRPYHRGRWVSLRPYGWTWIAGDPWGWPTHHYGRWGMSAGSWFWIPGRRWAPAWVSWASAPGYVSWCPLGWNDRPIFQLNVNVYGGRRYDPWDAWSVLPRHHFNRGYVNVSRFASVRGDARLSGRLVAERRGPDGHVAINRSGIPIRTAGRYGSDRNDRRPDGIGSGAGGGRAVDRGFPSPSRTPGTTLNPQPDRTPAPARTDGARAGVRDRGGRQPAVAPSIGAPEIPDANRRPTSVERPGGSPVNRRADGIGRTPPYESSQGDVTPAPRGAVRAVPRERGVEPPVDGGGSRTYRRQDRERAEPSVPTYQTPGSAVPRYSGPASSAPRAPAEQRYEIPAPAPRGDRGSGGDRADAPQRAPEASGRSQPAYRAPERQAPSGGSQPSYRAPERQAPSGGAERGPRGGDSPRPDRSGGVRERSSEGRTTGQATGRRR